MTAAGQGSGAGGFCSGKAADMVLSGAEAIGVDRRFRAAGLVQLETPDMAIRKLT